MVTKAAIETLKREDLEELGFLFNLNHELLSALGVSNEALDKLVYAAQRAGAFGAKLTGAGGGGCMIALVSKDRARSVMTAIEEAGGVPFTVRKDDEGVRAWLVR
jgi:mevalonate kinase